MLYNGIKKDWLEKSLNILFHWQRTSLNEGLSEPEFYGDLVYKFIGSNDFSFLFRKVITRYRRIGYNLNVMRQSTGLVFNSRGASHQKNGDRWSESSKIFIHTLW